MDTAPEPRHANDSGAMPRGATHKRACSVCSRRKVKCDKADPCSNCRVAGVKCLYEKPIVPRPRKRAANEELFARLAKYEALMRQHNIDFTNHANIWVPSEPKSKTDIEVESPEADESTSSVADSGPAAESTTADLSRSVHNKPFLEKDQYSRTNCFFFFDHPGPISD